MKYNLEGSDTQLRLEICAIQPNYRSMMECTHKLQEFNKDDAILGFWVAWIMIGLFVIGYVVGRWSND
jgi:hypothetical protein